MAAPEGWEHFERQTRPPPDQSQRLHRDDHGIGPPRRTRAWIAVGAAVLLVAAFALLLLTGGGENSPGSVGDPIAPVVDA